MFEGSGKTSIRRLGRAVLVGIPAVCGADLAVAERPACDPPAAETFAADRFDDLLGAVRDLQRDGCRCAVRELGERLLARALRDYGAESLEVAGILDVLTVNYYWLGGRDDVAIERARQALRIRLESPGDRDSLARSHLRLGSLLDLLGDSEEGERHYQIAREIWQHDPAGAGGDSAELYGQIAGLIDDRDVASHGAAWRQAWIAELRERDSAGGRSVLAVLDRLAGEGILTAAEAAELLERLPRDPPLAIALQAIALAGSAGGGRESRAYAQTLNVLGNLLHRRQLYDPALSVYRRCLEVRLRLFPPGHPQIARAYHNRGEALMLVGDFAAARPDLERAYALRVATSGACYRGAGSTTQRVLGKLLLLSGDLAAAKVHFRNALDRLELSYGTRHWRYALGLVSLAEVHEELDEWPLARRRYAEALAILQPGEPRAVSVQAKLGALLVRMGDLAAGEASLARTRELLTALAEPPLEDFATTLRGLAEIALARGATASAAALLREASELLTRGYDGVHPSLIPTLLAQAETELDLGAYEAARRTLDQVAARLPALGDAAYGARADDRLLRARLAEAMGDGPRAFELAAAAATSYARHLAPAFRVLPPQSARDFALRKSLQSLDLTLHLLAGNRLPAPAAASAWEAVARHRARVSEELEERYGGARGSSDPELRALLAELDRARRHLARTQIDAPGATTEQERRVLTGHAAARLRAIEQQLADRTATARLGGPAEEFDLGRLAAALPTASAVVAFVRFGSSRITGAAARYGAFVMSAAGRTPAFVDLGPAAALDQRVQRWRDDLLADDLLAPGAPQDGAGGDAGRRLRRSGAALRRALWEPVARQAGDAERIFLIPDGALFLVPFAALPGRREDHYLIDDGYELHRLVSERDLLASGAGPRAAGGLLAVGGPDFDAGRPPAAASSSPPSLLARLRETTGAFYRELLRDPCQGRDALTFSPLPEAGREVAEIAELYGAGSTAATAGSKITVLARDDATETAFKRLAPGHSVIHVATHGFLDLECRRPAFSRGIGDLLLDPFDRPRLVPGLAFAGANHRSALSGDDGILTVPEIAGLDLSGVDWVVLSACETAVGQIAAGEGLLGLAQAFRVAGAETLIVSLWPVEDQAARRWMTALHRARLAGRTTSGALRAASLAILAERRRQGLSTQPYSWAAFVAMGGWN